MRYLTFLLFFISSGIILGQNGGDHSFTFLEINPNVRVAALGGHYQVYDDDVNIGFYNPSLLQSNHHNKLALNYLNYVAGINYGLVGYARTYEKAGTFGINMQYLSYGTFDRADETSEITGTFTGGDYALAFSWGYKFDSVFSIGASVKPVYSELAGYSSFGLAADIGGSFIHPNKLTVISVLARNAGYQFKPYISGNRQSLPLHVQAGITHKLKYVPLRLSAVITHLEKYKLTYTDSSQFSTSQVFSGNQAEEPSKNTGDNLMRHVVLGGEFMLSQNFHLRVGFNYNQRQDLKTYSRTGLSGFSFGAGIKISKFLIGYSHSFLHLAGGQDMFSLSMDFDEFNRRN